MRSANPIVSLRSLALAILIGLIARESVLAQGTIADYERADALGQWAGSKVHRVDVQPSWSPDCERFIYRRDLREGVREFVVVTVNDGLKATAFDHEDVASQLGSITDEPVDPQKLPIDRIAIDNNGVVRFVAFDQGWHYDGREKSLTKIDRDEIPEVAARSRRRGENRRGPGARRARTSPDGRWTVEAKDHTLFSRRRARTRKPS